MEQAIDLAQVVEQERLRWINDECRAHLMGNLGQNRPQEGWKITNAVLMALGDLFDPEDEDEELPAAPALNANRLRDLIIFLDVIDDLQRSSGQTITMCAQDPDFSPRSIELLRSLNIQVLEDPQAMGIIKRDTFVQSPFFGFDYYFLGRERELRPTLYIGLPLEHHAYRAGIARVNDELAYMHYPTDVNKRRLEARLKEEQYIEEYDAESQTFALCEPPCSHSRLQQLEVVCPLQQGDAKLPSSSATYRLRHGNGPTPAGKVKRAQTADGVERGLSGKK